MSQDQPQPSSDAINPELSESVPAESVPAKSVPAESELPTSESPKAFVDLGQRSTMAKDSSRAVTVKPRSATTRRTPPENDEILPQTLLRLLGEAFVAAQPLVKQQSVKALRGTIHLLETTVERLEAEPKPKRKAPAPGKASENVLPPHSKPDASKLVPTLSTDALREKFQTVWQQLWRSWRTILRQLRKRLPASINRNFSDQALTGAVVGILAIVVWATGASPQQPQPITVTTPPVVSISPSPEPTPSTTPIPPIVQAPETPKPVDISPTPTQPLPPSPPLKRPPEQALIARIQDQVAAISNQYASGLVQSVQANFRGSRLIVNISDGWYGLSRSQQDKLAGELLRRTQALDFSKLEMVDGAGTLLARSPIVGADMILLKRTNASTEAA